MLAICIRYARDPGPHGRRREPPQAARAARGAGPPRGRRARGRRPRPGRGPRGRRGAPAPGGRGARGRHRRRDAPALSFQSQLPAAVEGFGEWNLDAFLWGEWHSDELGDLEIGRPPIAVIGKLRRKRSLSGAELAYARERTDRILKVTLPSPSLFANFYDPDRSRDAYPTLEGFLADVAAILREEVEELVGLGATYLQLDAPALSAARRPSVPRLLREPRLAGRALARPRPRARQPRRSATTPALRSASTCAAATRRAAGSWQGGYDWLASGSSAHQGRAAPARVRRRALGRLRAARRRPGGQDRRARARHHQDAAAGDGRRARRRAFERRRASSRSSGWLSRRSAASRPPIVGNALTIEDERAKLRTIVETASEVWALTSVVIDGRSLTIRQVVAVARGAERVELAPAAVERMRETRAVVERALARGDVVYGMTTGVGARKKVGVPRGGGEALQPGPRRQPPRRGRPGRSRGGRAGDHAPAPNALRERDARRASGDRRPAGRRAERGRAPSRTPARLGRPSRSSRDGGPRPRPLLRRRAPGQGSARSPQLERVLDGHGRARHRRPGAAPRSAGRRRRARPGGLRQRTSRFSTRPSARCGRTRASSSLSRACAGSSKEALSGSPAPRETSRTRSRSAASPSSTGRSATRSATRAPSSRSS